MYITILLKYCSKREWKIIKFPLSALIKMIDRCAFSFSTHANWVNQIFYYKWHKIKIMEWFILVFAQWSLVGKIGRQPDLGPMRLVLNTARHWLFFTCVWSSKSKTDTRYAYQTDCKLFISALKKFQWNMCIRQWKHVVSDDFSASPSIEHWKTKWRVTSLICT